MRRKASRIGLEAGTKLFVLLLVVFLLLADIGLYYAFSRLEDTIIDEFDRRLLVSSEMVEERIDLKLVRAVVEGKDVVQNAKRLRRVLRAATLSGRLLRSMIISKQSRILVDSRTIEQPGSVGLAEEGFPDLGQVWSGEELFVNVKGEGPLCTRYLLIPLSDGKEIYCALAVGSDFSLHRRLLRMTSNYILIRLVGLASVVGVALLFAVSVLRPFRRLKETAEVVRHEAEGEEDSEFIISTFQRVIEELKRKEAELERLYAEQKDRAETLEEYNRYILSSMSGGVVSADSKGCIVTFNKAAGEMLNVDSQKAVGKEYASVLRHPALKRMMKDALKRGATQRGMEVQLAGEKGGATLSVSSSVLKGVDEEVVGAALLLTDITELKILQEEIVFKEKLASLGEMSAGIAHQFKNSIGSIIGFANLLKKKGASISTIDRILKESMILNDVVNSFLSFAKPLKVLPSRVDLKPLIEDTLEPLEKEMEAKGIDSSITFPRGSLSITGDPVLLKQAFTNLFRNSIDAMREGGVLSVEV
ncbi:MAG: PAS domain-containing sensor histidine kinase, partial [bacterium]